MAHLANPITQEQLEEICGDLQLRAPLLVVDSAGTIRPDNSQERMTMPDIIVDEVRRVREELIEQYGGIDGYFKHCQQQDRVCARRLKSKRRKQAARKGRKTSRTRS